MVSTTVMGCWWADHILTTFTLILVAPRRIEPIPATLDPLLVGTFRHLTTRPDTPLN